MGVLYWWYNWGIWLALLLVAVVILGILYDSRRRMLSATTWLRLAILGGVLILPSLYLVLFYSPVDMILDLFTGTSIELRLLQPFGYLGIVGFLIGLGSAVGYALWLSGGGVQLRHPLPSPGPSYPPPLPPTEVAAPPPATEAPARPPSRAAAPPLDRTRLAGQQPPAQGWLVVRSGPHTGKQLGLSTSARSSIGRDATRCDLVLDDPAISREHARIQWERGQFVLYDLASANGTWVNNRRIQRQPLADGDIIRIGDTTLVFKSVR